MPDPDVGGAGGGEHLAVALGEGDVVDRLGVAGLHELGEETLRRRVLEVVDVARVGAAVEAKAAILVHARRGDAAGHAARQLGDREDLHALAVQHADAPVAAAHDDVAGGRDCVGGDTFGDQRLVRAALPVHARAEGDLEHVAGGRADEHLLVLLE